MLGCPIHYRSFVLSENLLNATVSYSTRHDGDNLSDHYPVCLDLAFVRDVFYSNNGRDSKTENREAEPKRLFASYIWSAFIICA